MKNILLLASLVAALAASASPAHATPASAEAQAARTLAVTGQLPVAHVGPYIQTGSYRIWVSSHLGRPSHVLPDGTWLYRDRSIENSAVGGTLAISFKNGRVSEMRLLSPAAVTALLNAPKTGTMVAAR